MQLFTSLFLALTLIVAGMSPAQADDRVFLLQLGSFESRADAQARWASLSETYPELLQGLSVRLLDVTLPTDNFTVYRTQAGALSSRADAQIICERLNARGDECYIVETAMFQPQAISTPNVAPAQAPTLAVDVPQLPTLAVQPPAVPLDSIESEMLQMEQALQDVAPSAPEMPSLQLGGGLEPLPHESKQSFWSRLNPFADGDANVTMSAPELTPQMPEVSTAIPAVQMAAAEPMAFRLPPPPALPSGKAYVSPDDALPDVAISDEPVMPPPVAAQFATPETIEPKRAVPSAVPFQVKRDGELVAPATGTFVAAGEEVRVAEAVAVPVTSGQFAETQRMSPAPFDAATLRTLGMPSKSGSRVKNLWAEIQYFDNQADALAFWDNFRRLNVGFPPVRVRVTNPYLGATSAKPRTALRVGPFEYENPIHSICAQVQGTQSSCKVVRDLGDSATAGRHRGHVTSDRAAARFVRTSAPQMYWVQLGGFSTPGEAHRLWETLRMNHAPLLNDMQPAVSTPQTSSLASTVYRLRTGPYPMRPAADQLCSSLKARGTKCITVFSH
jgi:hypothetical protein